MIPQRSFVCINTFLNVNLKSLILQKYFLLIYSESSVSFIRSSAVAPIQIADKCTKSHIWAQTRPKNGHQKWSQYTQRNCKAEDPRQMVSSFPSKLTINTAVGKQCCVYWLITMTKTMESHGSISVRGASLLSSGSVIESRYDLSEERLQEKVVCGG